MNSHKTVVIGIGGGIAAFKVIDLIKLLKVHGIQVEVILTDSATHLLDIKKLRKEVGKRIHTNLFPPGFDYKKVLKKRRVDHIDLADKADLMVLIPATANLVGKLAYGLADDFLTTTVLATKAPVMVCPTMNVNMWQHPAVQDNMKRLTKLGYQIVKPVIGLLACGYEGLGRLDEIKTIAEIIIARLNLGTSLKGKKILITAGATRDHIDQVRYLTSPSSGKMGVTLAEACYLRGATVQLIKAKNSVEPRYPLSTKTFTTTLDLIKLMKVQVPKHDIIFQVAAVGDFKPNKIHQGKLVSDRPVPLTLKPQIKILSQLKKWSPQASIVGFKAIYGTNNLKKSAFKKLTISQADALVVNDVSRQDIGFEAENNEVTIFLPSKKSYQINKTAKQAVAAKIVDWLGEQLGWFQD